MSEENHLVLNVTWMQIENVSLTDVFTERHKLTLLMLLLEASESGIVCFKKAVLEAPGDLGGIKDWIW